ncbi:MAG: RnfABCDGE type electron transport complex subunit D [Treponema sp.]|jgi:electron transport complex protein RnfD|nr:RnfABCDGE type electron transport complex subunit D [Treponema sp.]
MLLASSPHIVSKTTVRPLMATVLIALTPVTLFGCAIFGVPAILNVLVSVLSAVCAETAFRAATKQPLRWKDLSAVVTGLLLALIIPPSTPLWMTSLGSIFAIIVAKEFFGGLGANIFNPALVGRAFLIMSFPAALTTWHQPVGLGTALSDTVTTATPLNLMRQGTSLAQIGTNIGVGSDYIALIKQFFLGFRGGSIGETSILLIIAGAVFLLIVRTIDWRIPVALLSTTMLMSLLLGMDPLVGILTGGVFFGAVFMATDYASSPLTPFGQILFGCGAGIITVLIRKWGSFPEGVTYSILVMNAVTPFLNRFLPRKYGYVPSKKQKNH